MARTDRACLSISTAATTFTPLLSSARSKPPTPANSETAVICCGVLAMRT